MRHALATLLLLAISLPATAGDWVSREWTVMTTRAFLEFRQEPGVDAEATFSAVHDEFERINAVFSPWLDSSELARINRDAARTPVSTTAEVFGLFVTSGRFTQLTHGAFDASFASAGYLYDYRRHVAPDAKALAAAAPAIGWDHVQLDPAQRTVRYTHPGTRVDFGGIAKGYAIDRAVGILRARGVRHAYVALGGDSYTLGDRDGRPWQVGIRHPRNKDAAPIMLPSQDLAISTSGDYERYFDRDGERVHHILSPQSGKPVRGVVSVTIMADDSTTADALSTGVFVLGSERGLALVNALPGISAVIIADDGTVYYSDDLAPPSP